MLIIQCLYAVTNQSAIIMDKQIHYNKFIDMQIFIA